MATQPIKHHLHIGPFYLGDFDSTFEMVANIILSLLAIIPVTLYIIIFGILFVCWLI